MKLVSLSLSLSLSLSRRKFVDFVIGIIAGAMILMGGPVAWATQSPMAETRVNSVSTTDALLEPCTGPIGSSTAPLGDCVGTVTEADVVAVQNELWHDIFGTAQDPNLSYNLVAGMTFTGPGDYFGVNAYGVPFRVHVYTATLPVTGRVGFKVFSGWHIFGSVLCPTGVEVLIAGLIMAVGPLAQKDESQATTPGGPSGSGSQYGFTMAGRMSTEMSNNFERNEAADAAGSGGGLTDAQKQCAAGCARTAAAATTAANLDFAAQLIAATAVMIVALLGCAAALGFSSIGLLLGGACGLGAQSLYAAAVAAASLNYAGKFNNIAAAYATCMAGCGISVAYP